MTKGWILAVACGVALVVIALTGCATKSAVPLQPLSLPVIPAAETMQSLTSPGVIAEYRIPTTPSGAKDITAGPDGNLWFTETTSGKVGKVTTAGVFAEYPLSGTPVDIINGPNSDLWLPLVSNGEALAAIGTSGSVSETHQATDSHGTCGHYPKGGIDYHTYYYGGAASGPDGNLWLTSTSLWVDTCVGFHFYTAKINKVTPLFVYSYNIGGLFFDPGLGHIITGGDGNLWFTLVNANTIGRITTSGASTQFHIPTSSSGLSVSLTRGPDGNVWFAETGANKIGKITPAGVIKEYAVPTVSSGPLGITAGLDGNVWFTENTANKIGRITPAGVISEFPIRTANSGPWGITKGPDGNLWFVEQNANKIAKFKP